MQQFLRSKAFIVGAALALLIALYALAGFVFAPKLLRAALTDHIRKTLDLTPAVGEIRINPFKFQLEVKDFSLMDKNGGKLLGFDLLFVDFEFSSIWHRAFVFKEIDIAAPVINAIVARDGALNLLQLRPKSPAPKPQPDAKTEPLPAIQIGSFSVTRGLVTYEDRSRPSPFAVRLQPINFELQDFSTGVQGGRFTFSGSSKLGERVEWHGHVSVQPIESDGEFRVDALQAHTLWEYLEDQLAFAVNSGTVDLDATYRFSLKDDVDLHVDVSQAGVADLGIGPKGSDVNWVTVPQLTLSGTTVDLLKRQAHVDSLSLTGVQLVTWLEPDGSFNLLRLAASAAPRTPAAAAASRPPPASPTPVVSSASGAPTAPNGPAAPAVSMTPAAANPPWQFDLRDFVVRDASISTEDRSVQPALKLLLAPLSLQVTGASQDLAQPLKIALDTRINAAGSLAVTGDLTPQPLAADLKIKLAGIDLKAVQPYIAQHTSMTLLDGRLGGDIQLRYGSAKPTVKLSGNLSVEKLHTIDNALRDDFINWRRLDVLGLNFQRDPDRLGIEQIVIRKPYARVIIEEDTSLNVKRVLAGPAAERERPTPVDAPPVAALPAPKRHGSAARAAVGSGQATAAPVQVAATPMPMAIKKIVIQSGQVKFADLSVAPNFAAGIQALQGTVLGLSSKANSRATVDLHGSVDAFSPVSITGRVNLLSAALYTDLAMTFRNIELSTFNPYSGKFAGYDIAKGKLTTELHYKVDGRKLDAQHHIVIDQLEFGDKTASKDAVSLPIKLAVALLKDRNGVIDLNLPVTGSLDDPKFRIGPIIWKIFVNILEKAVTAPFALLGSLFGGGPDLQFIDFQPGAAVLDASAADKLKGVAKALIERPQLKIELPIAAIPDVDGPALIDAQFKQQLRDAETLKPSRKQSAPSAPAADFEQLEPAAKLDLLTQLYEKTQGGAPKYPQAVTSLKDKPAIAAAKIGYLTQELRKHIAIGDAELKALGERRAMALQQALLGDTQLDPARIFLVVNGKAKTQNGGVRLELSLR